MGYVLDIIFAIIPALVLGYVMPSIFTIFGLRIEGPTNDRYFTLCVLIYPLIVAAAAWIMWMLSIELTPIKFFVAILAATGISMGGTALRRMGLKEKEEKNLFGEGTGY